jgi:hypothetical protein
MGSGICVQAEGLGELRSVLTPCRSVVDDAALRETMSLIL